MGIDWFFGNFIYNQSFVFVNRYPERNGERIDQ